MIRYDVDPADLIARIQKMKPKWIGNAEKRKEEYKKAGKYTGGTEFWGQVKDVYISL